MQHEYKRSSVQLMDSSVVSGKSEVLSNSAAYISLLEQREEENRAEVARLTAEIRGLKLQLLQVQAQDVGESRGMSGWESVGGLSVSTKLINLEQAV